MSTTLVARPNYQGWPGRLHSGVLYTAMLETANWTVYGIRGRVGFPIRTGALDVRRWIATGEELRLTGRAVESPGSGVKIRVTAVDPGGGEVASLERDYDLPARADFLRRMGYPESPPELVGLLGDRAVQVARAARRGDPRGRAARRYRPGREREAIAAQPAVRADATGKFGDDRLSTGVC